MFSSKVYLVHAVFLIRKLFIILSDKMKLDTVGINLKLNLNSKLPNITALVLRASSLWQIKFVLLVSSMTCMPQAHIPVKC